MSRPPELEVEVGLLASQAAELEKHFLVSDFDRLRSVLADVPEAGSRAIRARLRFSLEQGHPVAAVEVDAMLVLTCQRCLEPVEWPVRSEARIAFVDAAEAAKSDDREPYETRNGMVGLRDLVEEELLLALPLVATHPAPAACTALAPQLEESDEVPSVVPAQKPFAGLKELLGRK